MIVEGSTTGSAPVGFVVWVNGKRRPALEETAPAYAFNTSSWTANSSTRHEAVIATGLDENAMHTIRLMKATESQDSLTTKPQRNAVTFHAFRLEGGDIPLLLEGPSPPPRKLRFIGDSLTAGLFNLCSLRKRQEAKQGFSRLARKSQQQQGILEAPWWEIKVRSNAFSLAGENDHGVGSSSSALTAGFMDVGFLNHLDEDHSLSYAQVACKLTRSSCHVQAVSGGGLLLDFGNDPDDDLTISDVTNRTLITVETSAANIWNDALFVPDAVFINLGTNDANRGAFRNASLTDRYVARYERYVSLIHHAYSGRAKFVLACGPAFKDYCEAVQRVTTALATRGIDATFFDMSPLSNGTLVCHGHPSYQEAAGLGLGVAKKLEATLGWKPS